MAEDNKKPAKKRVNKKTQTVRERAEQQSKVPKKRIRSVAKKVSTPAKTVKKLHKKEYHLPVPDNKTGRLLKKRVRLVPKFVRGAFQEIKLVVWPDRKSTIKLTLAVFVFALFIATLVGVIDLGLGKAFEKFILK